MWRKSPSLAANGDVLWRSRSAQVNAATRLAPLAGVGAARRVFPWGVSVATKGASWHSQDCPLLP
eukprot:CAMPEP_0182542972 /NCGR_PEP_ID=MMETSP1323-20130603/30955_1 /TAXON_ID=236787 /ORGANISM="Florenciella parvula, Strain RCC1693" /LENGTH=64 /DNA_ID=CAMNT_0024753867 /DNA_START=32 /DNA_END=222 /DNA_ORIENTATION=-